MSSIVNSVVRVSRLRVEYEATSGRTTAVDDVSFAISSGECLGIVGRSGSGKTQTCLAMMGLLPANAQASGSVLLKGEEILNLPHDALRRYRGSRMAMIFQDPMTSLTPHMRVGAQLTEVLVHHDRLSRTEAAARAVAALERVQIPDPGRRMRQYPHELSGGMRQRVMIAMALLCRPDLLIADEPTTALDVTVQAEILDLLREIKQDLGTAIAFITHDLAVVAELCDRAIVMLNGRIVEEAGVEALFHAPQHEYTRSLLRATPRLVD